MTFLPRSSSLPRNSRTVSQSIPVYQSQRPASARHRSRNKSESSAHSSSPSSTVEDPLNGMIDFFLF